MNSIFFSQNDFLKQILSKENILVHLLGWCLLANLFVGQDSIDITLGCPWRGPNGW